MKKLTIVAPSSWMLLSKTTSKKIETGVSKLGYTLNLGKNVGCKKGFLAGSDKERTQDLMTAFKDKNTDVIMALRGGCGSARLLPSVNWQIIKKNPKTFVGFSDTTAFQNALMAQANMPSVTGFLASFWTEKKSALMMDSLGHVLNGEGVVCEGLQSITKGCASGRLIGGCLSVFVGLLGTPYLPNLKGKILLLEDVGEEPYVIDRMLTHLKNAGVFNLVSGVILGEFYHCQSSVKNKGDGSIEQILLDHFSSLKIPVVMGMPYSHGPSGIVLPFGTKTLVNATKRMVCIDGLTKKY